MKRHPSPCAALLLPVLLLASCGTQREFREVTVGPAKFREVYDAIDHVARTDGFLLDGGESDAGFGIWQSRWRNVTLRLGRSGRYRLRAEIQDDKDLRKDHFQVLYCVEKQEVKDLSRADRHTEDDWSSTGQDADREEIFRERLVRQLVRPGTPRP